MTDRDTGDLFSLLEARATPRCQLWSDPASGLRAILIVDHWHRQAGKAAGGVRTRVYPSLAAAADDAARLARAMTLKCALGDVHAGGAKVVIMDHPGLDRPRAFARLGELVSELDGRFLTAGDLGTSPDDLAAMAARCPHVHTGERDLAGAVARGLVRCVEALAAHAGRPGLAGLRIAVQGCGAIGAEAARNLARMGATLVIADAVPARAAELHRELAVLAGRSAATVVDPAEILAADVDIVSPCAIGGVLTVAEVARLRAWAVCGAANNIVADRAAELAMLARGILHVPDIVASAGAVIDGVGERIMGLTQPERAALIDRLGDTARQLLADSARENRPPGQLAEERAFARIRAAEG